MAGWGEGAKPILVLGTHSTNVESLPWRNGKKGISKKCETSDRLPKWVSLLTWFHFSVVRRWKRTCAVCINLEIPHYLPSFRTIYIQKKPWLKETWSHRLLEIFQVYRASFIQPRCSYQANTFNPLFSANRGPFLLVGEKLTCSGFIFIKLTEDFKKVEAV